MLTPSATVSVLAAPVLSTQKALIAADADPFIGTHAAHATFGEAFVPS